jgi:hypothetical protein
MPRESIRAEATRRGITVYAVRNEREQQRGYASYSQAREERFRRQQIETERQRQAAMGEDFVLPPTGDFPLSSDEEPHGLQGPFGPTPDPAWDYYWPTRTINPPRPRTLQARYSRRLQQLEVIFRDGTPWHYSNVPPRIWNRFKRVESPGRYINAVLNGYDYGRGGWGSIE